MKNVWRRCAQLVPAWLRLWCRWVTTSAAALTHTHARTHTQTHTECLLIGTVSVTKSDWLLQRSMHQQQTWEATTSGRLFKSKWSEWTATHRHKELRTCWPHLWPTWQTNGVSCRMFVSRGSAVWATHDALISRSPQTVLWAAERKK